MRNLTRVAALVALYQLCVWCPPALAQAMPGDDERATAPQRNPTTAGVLEALTIPTLGYAYAGNWARGLPPAMIQLLGVGLILEQQYCLCIFEDPPPCEGACTAGIILVVGARLWAMVDASSTAKRSNARAQGSLSGSRMMPILSPTRAGVSFRIPIS
jgi:hypothetical protein